MRILLLSCASLLFFSLQAQPDTAFVSRSHASMVRVYERAMRPQHKALSGYVYSELRTMKNDHPYFPSDQWQIGSITYNDQPLDSVPLRFDAVSQILITSKSNGDMIALVREKLSSFDLGKHHFEWIDRQQFNTLPESGFYEVIYSGNSKLVCFREKQAQKTMVTQVYTPVTNSHEQLYYPKYRYFMWHQDRFYPVSNKNSMLELFGDQKKKLKKFSRQHHLDFKSNRDESFISILEFYDSLQ